MKETKSILVKPVSSIREVKKSNKKSKKTQRWYLTMMAISIILGISIPPYGILLAIPGVLAGIGFLKERQDFEGIIALFTKHVKNDIAQMLENEGLAETLDLNNVSIIHSSVTFYNDNLRKCVVNGDYILISDENKIYVIRQYYDHSSNVKLDVLDPEIEEDMLILEQDAPNVCESIKKLRLKS